MRCIRPTGIIICIIGLYLALSPIITLVQFIPLVGYLLSWMVAFTALIFAVVVGATLSCLTIAVAWVFYRPWIGVPLLLITAQMAYIIFFHDWGSIGPEDESTLQVPIATELSMVSRSLIKASLG